MRAPRAPIRGPGPEAVEQALWTFPAILVAALMPMVYSLSAGELRFLMLDDLHRTEVLNS
ncbi:MAG: hypothetical protein ACE5JJ_05925 [Nitrospinota bacterium]